MIICVQKRANYALGEPNVKEIVSHLLAVPETRSLVSDSFTKMHIKYKINVS